MKKQFLEQLQAEAGQLKTINPDFRCGSVTLYDGNSQKAAKVGPYCGESVLPGLFVSTSNKALIHFHTNHINTFEYYWDVYGFKLEYHPFSKLGFENRWVKIRLDH